MVIWNSSVFQTVECPVKLIPLETLHRSNPIPKIWRFETIGRIDNKITRFLNAIEEKAYNKLEFWLPYDAFIVAYFLDNSIVVKTEEFHMTIELSGFFTRGQVVLDHINSQLKKNVNIVEEVDVEKFKGLVSRMISETQS